MPQLAIPDFQCAALEAIDLMDECAPCRMRVKSLDFMNVHIQAGGCDCGLFNS